MKSEKGPAGSGLVCAKIYDLRRVSAGGNPSGRSGTEYLGRYHYDDLLLVESNLIW